MLRIRSLVASLLCVAVGAALLAAPALASTAHESATLDVGVLVQLNRIRTTHGLTSLHLNASLTAAAEQHSRDMVAKGYFAHDSLGGPSFEKRLESYYPYGNYGYWSVGENLFWESSTSINASAGIDAWMQSPEHRANILSPNWREIGIAAISVPSASGTFGGMPVTVITTDFGVRR